MMISIERRVCLASAVLITAAIALSGCASSAQVRSAPGTDIASFNTFAFASPFGTDRSGYSSFLSTSLKGAARKSLEAKGYKYSEAGPRMLVNFSGSKQQKTEVNPALAAGPGFYGFRGGMYGPWAGYNAVDQYEEGTLMMDLVDASKKELMWEGTTTVRKTDLSKWKDEDVQKTVQKIVDQVPAAR